MTAVLVFCIFAFTDADGAVPDGAGPAMIGATVKLTIHGPSSASRSASQSTSRAVPCRVHRVVHY